MKIFALMFCSLLVRLLFSLPRSTHRTLLTLVVCSLSTVAFSQTATPPDLMSYQGFLVDANGNPLATNNPVNFTVVFRIYASSTGGTTLWTESQTVTVDKGNLSVVLGEGVVEGSEPRPSISSLFSSSTSSDRYLGITVKGLSSGDPEIAPRLRLLPSPYAFLARTANGVVAADGTPLLVTDSGRLRLSQSLQSTGGNPRGNGATDLQMLRQPSSPGQVASGAASAILGGQNNTASGDNSIVGAGTANIASGIGSVVSGGDRNSAGGTYSIVPGGQLNSAAGDYSFAVGRRSKALHLGSFVFGDASDADKSSTGANQFIVVAGGGASVNSSPTDGVSLNVGGALKADSGQFGTLSVSGSFSATSVSGNGSIPIGGIIMWSGSVANIPSGWALCDGKVVSGLTTPDLRNRFIVGIGSRNPGDLGGSETISLSVDNLPAHNHVASGNTGNAGSHTHSYVDYFWSENDGQNWGWPGTRAGTDWDNHGYYHTETTDPSGDHNHYFSVTTSTTGGGQAFNKLPPYYAMAFIIRVQ